MEKEMRGKQKGRGGRRRGKKAGVSACARAHARVCFVCDRPTHKHTGRQACLQTDRQTNSSAGWQADRGRRTIMKTYFPARLSCNNSVDKGYTILGSMKSDN